MICKRMVIPMVRRWSVLALLAFSLVLMPVIGCKTSEDAASAASQLTATATTLSGYYAALESTLNQTDQLYRIQAALNPLAPYDAQTADDMAGTIAEVKARQHLASSLAALAEHYAALGGSKSAADTAAAAGNLEAAVEGLRITNGKMSANQLNLMKEGVTLIVKAIQEHKEREASEAIDRFAAALEAWFQSEIPLYDSIVKTHAAVSRSLAQSLISQGQIDGSASLGPVLSPYGLTLQLSDPALKGKLQALLSAQVQTKSAAMIAEHDKASAGLAASLHEMARRIHLVASGSPMALRTAPITLDEARHWIGLVPQFAPQATRASH